MLSAPATPSSVPTSRDTLSPKGPQGGEGCNSNQFSPRPHGGEGLGVRGSGGLAVGNSKGSANPAPGSAAFASQILAPSSAGNRTRSMARPHRFSCSTALTPAYS